MVKSSSRPMVIVILLLSCWSVDFAQADLATESEVRATAVRFADAMVRGDVAALSSLIWRDSASSAHQGAHALFLSLISSQKNLEQAAGKFDGAAGSLANRNGLLFTSPDRDALRAGRVYFQDSGRQAYLVGKTSILPMHLFRGNGDSPWCVVVEELLDLQVEDGFSEESAPESMARIRTGRFKAIATALNAVAAKITSGELATAVAVEAELASQLQSINDTATRRRIALLGQPQNRKGKPKSQ